MRGRFWHQGPTGRPFRWFAEPAKANGRYHRVGGYGVWYASDREQTAWAELFRHAVGRGIDPFEVFRRVGAAEVVNLEVLDLCDEDVRSLVGLSLDDLTGNNYSRTQEVAEAAQRAGFQGIIAPSAALPGNRTLVVFKSGRSKVRFDPSRVRQPPPRMTRLVRLIAIRSNVSTELPPVPVSPDDRIEAVGLV